MILLKESNPQKYKYYKKQYKYYGIDTCATTSLCKLKCPVDIDTGKFIKDLKSDNLKLNFSDRLMQNNFSKFERISRFGSKFF